MNLAEKIGYTPGPWRFAHVCGNERKDGSDWGANGLWTEDNKQILGDEGGWDGGYGGPSEENERLIAAAPQILEALVDLLDCPSAQHYQSSALNAIKAATGLSWEELT